LQVSNWFEFFVANGRLRLTETMTQPGVAAQFPSVGRWSVTGMPGGWIYVADFGIRQMKPDARAIAASVGVGQDALSSASELTKYVEKQMKLIGNHLKESKFAGPQPTAFPGADEAQLLFVRHSVDSAGNMLHAQTYVRSGLWIGIITLTTLEELLRAVRPDYDAFVKGLRIREQRMNEPGVRT
jgi:hypothetical protein